MSPRTHDATLQPAIAAMQLLGAGPETIEAWLDQLDAAAAMATGVRILLFEDNDLFAERIAEALNQKGARVSTFIGGRTSDTDTLLGIYQDPAGPQIDTPINPEEVDLVFADSQLWQSRGINIVAWCKAHSIPCVAISGDDACNRELINAGAVLAITKNHVSNAIAAGLSLSRLAAAA